MGFDLVELSFVFIYKVCNDLSDTIYFGLTFFSFRCSHHKDFVDSMDEANYVAVELVKPMGIIFEENDSEYGGIFVQSLKEGGAAAENGVLKPGDQLVAVGTKNVSGLDFDDALGVIIDSPEEKTKLNLFRGTAKQFYGPTGPSKEWLANFCEKEGVNVGAT